MFAAFTLTLLLAYLFGSFSPSYLAGFLFREIDLRTVGSGNLGFSNALRVLGWKLALPVLVLDVSKGIISVLLARFFAGFFSLPPDSANLLFVLAGLAAILGHSFTCFHSFRGGKGIATALGVYLILAPRAVSFAFLIWFLTVLISRYISLGSVFAAISLPFFIYFFDGSASCCNAPTTSWTLYFSFLISIFIIYKHSSNIKRILSGNENKINLFKK